MTHSCVVLALYPTSRRLGFAVFDGSRLVDWGMKKLTTKADTEQAKELLGRYMPDVVVLEQLQKRDSNRSHIAFHLVPRIETLARSQNVRVRRMTWKHVLKGCTGFIEAGLEEFLDALVLQVPDLIPWKPPLRKPWMPEHHNMPMFRAVALGLVIVRQRRSGVKKLR